MILLCVAYNAVAAMLLLCTQCRLRCDFRHDHVVLLCTYCRWCWVAMLLRFARNAACAATAHAPCFALHTMPLVVCCNAPSFAHNAAYAATAHAPCFALHTMPLVLCCNAPALHKMPLSLRLRMIMWSCCAHNAAGAGLQCSCFARCRVWCCPWRLSLILLCQ